MDAAQMARAANSSRRLAAHDVCRPPVLLATADGNRVGPRAPCALRSTRAHKGVETARRAVGSLAFSASLLFGGKEIISHAVIIYTIQLCGCIGLLVLVRVRISNPRLAELGLFYL